MKKEKLIEWVHQIAQERKIILGDILYLPDPSGSDEFRNIIFDATYDGQPAVLKVYDDHRLIHESESLQFFHQKNTSTILTAPKLLDSGILDYRRGWILMEKIPVGSIHFTAPMPAADRAEFLKIFIEYRKHFPTVPPRALNMIEQLSADEFQRLRIHRWMERAAIADVERARNSQPVALPISEFLTSYYPAIEEIARTFATHPMIWCHGHFKPQEVFIIEGRPYITDFGHMSMYPEGYELGFIIWADFMTAAAWDQPVSDWQDGLAGWMTDMEAVATTLDYTEPKALIRAAVLERLLGTILADVCASTRPQKEIQGRLSMLLPALKKLTA